MQIDTQQARPWKCAPTHLLAYGDRASSDLMRLHDFAPSHRIRPWQDDMAVHFSGTVHVNFVPTGLLPIQH